MTATAERASADGVARPAAAHDDWRRSYARRLILSDLAVIVIAVFGSQAIWYFGAHTSLLRIHDAVSAWSYAGVSVVLVAGWLALLAFFATRELRYLGAGPAEYRFVLGASLRLLALVLLAIFLFRLDVGRGPLLTAIVAGTLLLLLERWLWRKWLVRQRASGRMTSRMLVAGSVPSVAHLVRDLQRASSAGYVVVGACIPAGVAPDAITKLGVPVVGDLDQIQASLELYDADTLALASSDHLPASKVRELSWALEPGQHHLVVAPSLTDIGGPRIRVRPVAGLPLIHIETPKFERGQRALKRTADVVGAAMLVVLLSPMLAVIALVVRTTSPGPALFRQTRVGRNGRPFTMYKFRSMIPGAESGLASLSALDRAEGNEILFKMRDDPRVTKVGAWLRRYSLDELPQLFNVLQGTMSIVGPRPPLESEVERYESHVHRRFLMKPGITGLWQVSGRSNLSWEDSVRLDLYYVENWSLIGDLVILWRTVRAVVQRDGAY